MKEATASTSAPAVAQPPTEPPAYQRFLRMWHSAPLDEPPPPPQRAAVPTPQPEEAADGGAGRARGRAGSAASARHIVATSASPRFA